jgi:type IV pilus assembly protein PilX
MSQVTLSSAQFARLNRQRGATLLVTLLFLIILTMLGISAMSGSTTEERMARNSRDYNVAFQAAEAALRDAERDLTGQAPYSRPGFLAGEGIPGQTGFMADCGLSDTTNSYKGLCDTLTSAPASPVWVSVSGGDPWRETNSPSVAYGTYTGRTPFPTCATATERTSCVARQPRYLIEARVNSVDAGTPEYIYRITARGFGPQETTVVSLQQNFKPL